MIQNPEYMEITSSTFLENKVLNNSNFEISGDGGAIYYPCDSTYKCNVTIRNNNIFKYNYADNSGGAIKWNDLEPNDVTENTF
jgi:hypothetical protein